MLQGVLVGLISGGGGGRGGGMGLGEEIRLVICKNSDW